MKLIDKDALVAEIEKRMEERDNSRDEAIWNNELWPETEYSYRSKEDESIIDFIDTLEVKEVDLDKEIEKCLKQYHMIAVGKEEFEPIAKHFFELGLKAQKGEQDDRRTIQKSM